MPTITKNRRPRSKLTALSDEHRSAVYDLAKQRMKAQADQQLAQANQQERRHVAEGKTQQQELTSVQKGAGDTTRRVHEPVEKKPANVAVNRNEGNPREGQKFRIRQVAGGVQHVYGDGTRVFVRKHKSGADGPAKGVQRGSTGQTDRQQALERIAEARREAASGKDGVRFLRKRKAGRST